MPLYVGAISGTSVDGIDLALVDIDSTITVRAAKTAEIPSTLRTTLKNLAHRVDDDVMQVGLADAELGHQIGAAIADFLQEVGVDARSVTAIGSHGQTIRHHPEATYPFTVQIGDPSRIVERTGITTVADFRRRDIAAGGEGAPLVPPFHRALLGVPDEDTVVLNVGGIANITLLETTGGVTGFDTGPGNALLDAWVREERNEPFDKDGRWAATGSVDQALLNDLMNDEFISRDPPKSTGKEHYHLAFIEDHIERLNIEPANVQATLLAFTAQSIAFAIEKWASPRAPVVVCGGGRRNAALMESLGRTVPGDVSTIEERGFDGDAIEAAAFAWLAARTLAGQPGNAAEVTGASGPRVLGAIYPA